jgi:hypothetical protein
LNEYNRWKGRRGSMTVARPDANRVNPGTALAVAPDKPRATHKAGGGSASSKGGRLPDAPVQRRQKVGGTQAASVSASIRIDGIKSALKPYMEALKRETEAQAKYDAHPTKASAKAVAQARAEVSRRQTKFGDAVDDEVERRARTGPFDSYPRSAEVRQRAELVAKSFSGQTGESFVRRSLEISQLVRVVTDVTAVNEETAILRFKAFSGDRLREFTDIRDDAVDYVTRPRPDEMGAQVKYMQSSRLTEFVKNLKEENQGLDDDVVAAVVIPIFEAMFITTKGDLHRLEKIVAPLKNEALADWIRGKKQALP